MRSFLQSYLTPVQDPVQIRARISRQLHQAVTISMPCNPHFCTANFKLMHRKTALTFSFQNVNFTPVDGRKGSAEMKVSPV
jgi:hypothetical protein